MVFRDPPSIPPGAVGKFMVTQMAAVAELEAAMISARTKAALAAAKARGVALGGRRRPFPRGRQGARAASTALRTSKARQRAADLYGIIADLRSSGAESLRDLAVGLNARSIPTPRGGKWSAVQVSRVLARLQAAE
jgi:DNA invertase Pin-like site-specific DNA recombinase